MIGAIPIRQTDPSGAERQAGLARECDRGFNGGDVGQRGGGVGSLPPHRGS